MREPGVVGGRRDAREDRVALARGERSPRHPPIERCGGMRESQAHRFQRDVAQADVDASLRERAGDRTAHRARADDRRTSRLAVHRRRRSRPRPARECLVAAEQAEEILRHGRHGEPAEGLGFRGVGSLSLRPVARQRLRENRRRRRVVPAGLATDVSAHSSAEKRAAERRLAQEPVRRPLRERSPAPGGGAFRRRAHRDALEELRGDQPIDETQAKRRSWPHALARKEKRKRRRDAESTREAPRSPEAGEDSQPHFGRANETRSSFAAKIARQASTVSSPPPRQADRSPPRSRDKASPRVAPGDPVRRARDVPPPPPSRARR